MRSDKRQWNNSEKVRLKGKHTYTYDKGCISQMTEKTEQKGRRDRRVRRHRREVTE